MRYPRWCAHRRYKATIMMVESPVLPGRTRTDAICANLPYAVGYARRSSELFPNTALDLGDGRLNGSRPVLTVFKTAEQDSLDYSIVSKAIKEKDPVKLEPEACPRSGSLEAVPWRVRAGQGPRRAGCCDGSVTSDALKAIRDTPVTGF
ncbi:MAG: hypothetical protein ACLTL8_02565 [Bifidobacterium pseudocatenulatum]